MSLSAAQTEMFVLVGGWGGKQWFSFCCFSRELGPTTRLILPSMNGVRATAGFTQKCKHYSRAHFCRLALCICSRAFHPDQAEGAVDPPLPASPQGELCFSQPSCLMEWSGKAMWARWRPFEGHIRLGLMSSSAACVDGDKESPRPIIRSWSQICLQGEAVASVCGIMDEIFIIN